MTSIGVAVALPGAAFEQVIPRVYTPAAGAVTERGDTADVLSVQPGRLTELPPNDAEPVQAVAPFTDQLTENGVPAVAVEAFRVNGLGDGAPPVALTVPWATPLAFVHVTPNV